MERQMNHSERTKIVRQARTQAEGTGSDPTPTKWADFIREGWPFESPESLTKFGVLVHYLRFRFDFDYVDTRVYVEKALGRKLELGEFDDVMAAFERSVQDSLR
jgi:hypothetical protein|tara:strand:+ start:110 stop:421 length:312 start_codon:yes stop_codon:yes gene_type:complete